jgi:D-sedoheptulose 7-phosphate isomerase
MKEKISKSITLHKELVKKLENTKTDIILEISKTIINSLNNQGCIYICGNGGSAADAQHIAAELIGRFKKNRKSIPAVALSTNTSIVTSIGNDFNFEQIFSRQIDALLKPNDILWVLSTSGTSPNIISAAESARKKGVKVIAFTGKTDCKLEEISDLCLSANTDSSSGAQEIHQLAYHIICELVEDEFYNLK